MTDYKILAVDFDKTLFDTKYPIIISPNWAVIEYVKYKKQQGWIIILTTCRHTDEDMKNALNACESVGLTFDYVNENAKEPIEEFGECRKIFCHELIDDTCIKTVAQIEMEWNNGKK